MRSVPEPDPDASAVLEAVSAADSVLAAALALVVSEALVNADEDELELPQAARPAAIAATREQATIFFMFFFISFTSSCNG